MYPCTCSWFSLVESILFSYFFWALCLLRAFLQSTESLDFSMDNDMKEMHVSVKVTYSILFRDLCPAGMTACCVLLLSNNHLDAQKREDFEKADPVPRSMLTVATQKDYSQEEQESLRTCFCHSDNTRDFLRRNTDQTTTVKTPTHPWATSPCPPV